MHPILLHHGIFGYDHMQVGPLKWSYFGGGIEQEIAMRGHPVIVASVSRTGSIANRAEQLKQILTDELAALGRMSDRVVIFAHSMGGLDARYMIRKLGMADRVAALVTLSTPHRGSSYADWVVRNIDRSTNLQKMLTTLGIDLAGVRDLTLSSVAAFNEDVTDHPEVAYYSVSAARPWHRVPAFLLHAHRVVTDAEGENDGIVSVASAQWGTHLETWPADHMHVVNRRMVLEIRQPTGNICSRYLRVLDRLAADGILPASHSSIEPPRSSSADHVRT